MDKTHAGAPHSPSLIMHVHSSEIYPDFVKILIEPFYRLCVFDIITSND